MARHDRTTWTAGLPFPAAFPDPAVPVLRLDEADRLAAAQVNLDRIAEPNEQVSATGIHTRRAAAPGADPIRLLPLGAFARGDSALPAHPRPRQNHTLIWLTSGTMTMIFAQYRRDLGPGDLIFVPLGAAFAVRPSAGIAGQIFLIAPHLTRRVQPAFPARPLACHPSGDMAGLLAILRELASEAADRTPPAVLGAHLGLLSHRLLRMAAPLSPKGADGDRGLLARFLHVAGQSLSEPASIADLARTLGSSIEGLDRACIARRGKRAVEVLNDLRLARAIGLLRRTDQSPGQIAAQLGYASHAHLARDLSRATGQRPEAFRAQPC